MLALKVPPRSISIQTGVPERTIRDIKRRFIETGDPTPPQREAKAYKTQGLLSADDMKVCGVVLSGITSY